MYSLNKNFMYDINTDIITDGERYFVISENKWNGQNYYDCFEILEDFSKIKTNKRYIVTPVYEQIDEDNFNIIDYKVEEE